MAANNTAEVRAEWPGRVAAVHVGEGDRVTEGQDLVTLEAMKMLTPLSAPRDGVVTAVLVKPDDFVESGSALVRLD